MHIEHRQNTRRAFTHNTVAAAIGLTGLPSLAARNADAASPGSAGWIDAHVHVWHPDTARYPISQRFSKADMQPPSFTDEELLGHCKPVGVQRVVLIQMSFYEYDHHYLRSAMQRYPEFFSGVALIDFQAKGLLDRMEELADQGMRGFRLHATDGTEQWLGHSGMKQLWRRAGELGLAICPLINPVDIENVETLSRRFPETTVVVDHFARIGVSGTIEVERLDALCNLAKLPNVYLKTSAFYALGKKQAPYEDLIPMIRRVFDSFGPQRLMWGSDCPYQVQAGHEYRPSLALIEERIDFLSQQDREWILRGTAEKVFFA